MLPKSSRLTQSDDYARVRKIGRSRAHPLLILASAPHEAGFVRVGLTVGKKVGTAVQRNRAKRLLREAARAVLPRIASGQDIVLIGRPETAASGLAEVSSVLEMLLRRGGLLSRGEDEGARRGARGEASS